MNVNGIIHRDALIKKIRKKSVKKKIFLTSPAGYGKTIAAMQWLTAAPGASAQITISDEDNDPSLFYKRIINKLLKLVGKSNCLVNTEFTEEMLMECLEKFPLKNTCCYLFIDDFHRIKNETLLNSLLRIITSLPGYICLCLAARSAPSDHWLQSGMFAVFTQDDLKFTTEEIEWLSIEKDRNLTKEQINNLLETTGGWAMYLSALLSDNRNYKAQRIMTQYLKTQVWDSWDIDTKKTLLKLAVPTEITPELCEKLTLNTDGCAVIEHLTKKENAFLSPADDNTYRFHDIFRNFLLEYIDYFLRKNEIRQLHDTAAEWYYQHNDYLAGARHYIQNRDHNGVHRCLEAVSTYHEKKASISSAEVSAGSPKSNSPASIEHLLNFADQNLNNLPAEFISENPYLILRSAVAAYHNGDIDTYTYHLNMIYHMLPDVVAKYPALAATIGFIRGANPRIQLREYVKELSNIIPHIPKINKPQVKAKIGTITQNLPYFHRSMRDFSEYYELHENDLQLITDTFGVMIGNDYKVIKESLIAGIYYEKGNLPNAVHHALNGYHKCEDGMHPETLFSSYMILTAILYAIGDLKDTKRFMLRTEAYIKDKAQFLYPNFKALQTEYAIRSKVTEAAKEWLDAFAYRAEQLPFYQIFRHFTTLRSYIALGEFTQADKFGQRLYALATDYNRPLDQIESCLLRGIALQHEGKKEKAVLQIKQAVCIAMPYGFTQLFINEGKEILSLLCELRERKSNITEMSDFLDNLCDEIFSLRSNVFGKEPPPALSPMKRKILAYLEKGMSYNEIAVATGLARGSIKTHILLTYKQLGVHSAQEAIEKAKILKLL